MGKILQEVPKNPASFFGLNLLVAFNKLLLLLELQFLYYKKMRKVTLDPSLRLLLVFLAKSNKLMIKKRLC